MTNEKNAEFSKRLQSAIQLEAIIPNRLTTDNLQMPYSPRYWELWSKKVSNSIRHPPFVIRRLRLSFRVSRFTLISGLDSFVIRHSPFVIRHSSFAIRHCICVGPFTNWRIGSLVNGLLA